MPPTFRPGPRSQNDQLLAKYLDARAAASRAQARAQAADAQVSKVRAEIETAGKVISYDWKPDGKEIVRVVDRA